MARPHGFDHFCEFLKGLESHYVIIGGGAAALLMDDAGLQFRATKDIDLVVLSRSAELNAKIISYVEKGQYKVNEATSKTPKYYRFKAPENKDCPAMIEIFARNEFNLKLQWPLPECRFHGKRKALGLLKFHTQLALLVSVLT